MTLFGQAPDGKTQKKYNDLVAGLKKHFERHKKVINIGTTDPFWPDGINANLIRNHILYHKSEIRKICEKHGMSLPECYHVSTPGKINNDYMAPNSKAGALIWREGCLDQRQK